MEKIPSSYEDGTFKQATWILWTLACGKLDGVAQLIKDAPPTS